MRLPHAVILYVGSGYQTKLCLVKFDKLLSHLLRLKGVACDAEYVIYFGCLISVVGGVWAEGMRKLPVVAMREEKLPVVELFLGMGGHGM